MSKIEIDFDGSVSFDNRHDLPEIPAIYFVMSGDALQYIGRTVNLKDRWQKKAHHKHDEVAELDKPVICWLESDLFSLDAAEDRFLRKYRPPLNRRFGSKRQRFVAPRVFGIPPNHFGTQEAASLFRVERISINQAIGRGRFPNTIKFSSKAHAIPHGDLVNYANEEIARIKERIRRIDAEIEVFEEAVIELDAILAE